MYKTKLKPENQGIFIKPNQNQKTRPKFSKPKPFSKNQICEIWFCIKPFGNPAKVTTRVPDTRHLKNSATGKIDKKVAKIWAKVAQ